MKLCGIAIAIVAVALLLVGVARADDEEEARAAMRRGIAAFGRGDAEAALVEYEAAKKLAPAANAPFLYAAEALVALARWREAVDNFEIYLAKNPSVSDAERVRERIATIRGEHYPGRVHVVANVEGATVAIDGVDRGAAGTTFEIEPGPHKLEARAPERVASAQDVTVVGDTETTISFSLAQALAPPPITPPPIEPAPPTSFTLRTVGWIGAGTGAAVIVASVIVDGAVLGPKLSDYRQAAERGDVAARALHDEAKNLRTAVLVGYVGGAVLVVGGLALAFFAPKPALRQARLSPFVGVDGRGGSAAFTF